MMGVSVQAPGPSGFGTKIFNADTGDEIKGVFSLVIRIEPDDIVRVAAQVFAREVQVNGPAEFVMTDPATGETKILKRIEFADGSEWQVSST